MTQQAEPIAQALREALMAYVKLDAHDTARVLVAVFGVTGNARRRCSM